MIGLIIRPDKLVEVIKTKNPKQVVHGRAIYMVEPWAVRKLNGKIKKPEPLNTEPLCVWVWGNPVPVGAKDPEDSFRRTATEVWLTRTLEQLAAPKLFLPGKYVMWFIIILILLGVLFGA